MELPLCWDMCGYRGYLFASAKDEPAARGYRLFLFYRAFIIRGTPRWHKTKFAEGMPRRALDGLGRKGSFDCAQDDGVTKAESDIVQRSTYLANIFSGSIAMKVPRLRARTSFFSLRISAVLMC